ncbi:hypothetical protein ASC82_00725 [Streptomyces sp. Root431]|uniref:hypothetical protein n=1 Tax=Streptomyces sp. Root431 TaxID=1736535 RepID=UPI000701CA90|nr:hypothetical protein [Streptomyces sp. Root431]KQX16813.1 hypothetical protein ASC82_00725 [Streptomyces sp. Root431]
MTPHNELRLLPWSGPDGKPCFLSTADSNSRLSRLADNAEATQLGFAAELLDHASAVLGDGEADLEEVRALATDLTGVLRETLRVAESRGHRLLAPGPGTHVDDTDDPTLPAAAFG